MKPQMTEDAIKEDAFSHFNKKDKQLAMDIVREANASQEEGGAPDRIKHLVKVMALQQLVLAKQARRTNCYLLLLSVITTLAACASFYLAYLVHNQRDAMPQSPNPTTRSP